MKATELRIGNLVNYNNETVKVNSFTRKKITIKRPFSTLLTDLDDDFEGTQLTQEWYIKFGYECLQELIVDMIHNAIHPISEDISIWATTISGLKVHELQNLYFVLTGEELTYETL